MLNSFQSPLYRVFFFNIDEALESYRHSKVSVPIISGLLFQLIALGGAALYRRPFQSPLYRVFFFNWSETTTRQAYSLFQSPLYRVFFFNPYRPAWMADVSNWFQSPLYRVFFFNWAWSDTMVSWKEFQSPLYRVFFFNHTLLGTAQQRYRRFSPHYIGSSFSTTFYHTIYVFNKSFSPHYIGSSFSTNLKKKVVFGQNSWFQSPLYRVFFFNG